MLGSARRACVVGLACALGLAARAADGQTILRVKPSTPAGDNGQTWATAYDHLQDALAAAASITGGGISVQVWVAAGTYRPDTSAAVPNGTNSRSATFQLIDRVALYGGFAGTETQLSEGDPSANVTVLTGDLANDDAGWASMGDNCYHIVTASGVAATAVLDGFRITAGNADASAVARQGGGLYNDGGSPIIARCDFVRNSSHHSGGGAANLSAGPAFVSCRFLGNRSATADGGALYFYSGAGVFVNCLFSGNAAEHPALLTGGALYASGYAVVTFGNCTFAGNRTLGHGGAIFMDSGAELELANCILWGNTAPAGWGPQLALDHTATADVRSCLLEGGCGDVWYNNGSGPPTCMEVLVADPLFVDPDGVDAVWGTLDDDLRVMPTSPVIDTGSGAEIAADTADLDGDGNTNELIPFDITGKTPRVLDGNGDSSSNVDFGAFERRPGVLYVDASKPAGGSGYSWAGAFNTLQAALAAAQTGDQIWVAAGTYTPTVLYTPGDPASAEFRLVDGVKVFGGFAGTETALNQRNPNLNATIITGERGVPGDALPGDNIRVLVRATGCGADTVLDGFTITRAAERAVVFSAGAAIMSRCTLLRNYAAFYCEDGDHAVVNCRFLGNGNSDSGVGVYLRNGGSVAITNSEFVGNYTSGWGAALVAYLGDAHLPSVQATIKNCTFFGNTAPGEGSLAVTVAAQLLLANCVVGDAEGYWTDSQGAPHSFGEYCLSFGPSNGPGYLDWGAGILGPGPLFVRAPSPGPDGQWGTADDDYGDLRLLSYAECLDAGSNAALPADVADLDGDGDTTEELPFDLGGLERVHDGDGDNTMVVDMGAHEYAGAPFGGVLYVDREASPGGTGESWATAFRELRDALPVSAAIADPYRPVQVWVAAGTYKPSQPLNQGGNQAVSFQLASNVALYGGFAGSEMQLSQRDPNANVTTLSGDLNGDDNGALNRGDNSWNVVFASGVDSSGVLDGFTIRAGHAADAPSTRNCGGGLRADGGTPHLRNLVFVDNDGPDGGGLCCDHSSAVVEDCTFLQNTAAHQGGGTYGYVCSPTYRRCRFESNTATGSAGGGLVCDSAGTTVLVDCLFLGNDALYGGGAYQRRGAGLYAINCRFLGNTSYDNGAGLCSWYETAAVTTTLVGCAFVHNQCQVTGGGGGVFVRRRWR